MTTTPPDPTEAAAPTSATAPPPGCPAHGLDSDGIARLYGAELENDAMGLYERLRKEHGSVAPILLGGDVPAWLVLGYREILDVARTPSRYTRDSRVWRELRDGKVPQDSPLLPMVAWQPLCLFFDGEEHERLRAAVTESMARFDRRGIRRHVTRFTDQLVDEFCANGEADLVQQFAEHLPMLVMTHLIGMPDEYGPRLVAACRDLMKGTETALASNDYVVETLEQLVKRKREAPGHDLASWLMTHRAELTNDEVVQHLRLVLVAANETTVNLIANTLKMVLTDRRFRASLAGGHMTLPDAVEQLLWDEPPLSVIPGRWALSDTELGGQAIKSGDMLLLGLAAGNADPAIRPDRDAPMHGNRSHLAFSGGPHECPGQDIGRAIADCGVDALLMRLPDIRLAVPEEELEWDTAWLSRHLAALPVEFARTKPKLASASASVSTDAASIPETAQSVPPSTGEAAPTPTAVEPSDPPRSSWWRSIRSWLRRP